MNTTITKQTMKTCERCNLVMRADSMSRHMKSAKCINFGEPPKIYYEENKEKILKRKKIHYEENKEDILEKKKQNVICDICGASVRKHGIKKHQRTKKCKTQADQEGNPVAIIKKQRPMKTCERCDKVMRADSMPRHMKSKICENFGKPVIDTKRVKIECKKCGISIRTDCMKRHLTSVACKEFDANAVVVTVKTKKVMHDR